MKTLEFFKIYIVLVAVLLCSICRAQTLTVKDTVIYSVVDSMPSFPGGMDSLNSFFKTHIDTVYIHQKNTQVLISIVVNESGNILYPKISVFPDGSYPKEKILDVVKLMPSWNAGRNNGVAVKVHVKLPVLIIDSKNGVYLDTAREERYRQASKLLDKYRKDWAEKHSHSVFYEDAEEALKNKDYKTAIRNFDKSIVGTPFDLGAWAGRMLSYLLLSENNSGNNNRNLGCMDFKFLSYLTECADSAMMMSGMSFCVADYFFNKENFLSDGIVIPSKIHSDNYEDETLDQQPTFPGGVDSLYKYLSANLMMRRGFPYESYKFRILVKFTISKSGEVEDPVVLTSVPNILADEARRLVLSMPKWTPAIKNKKPVAADYIFPVLNFKYRRSDYLKDYLDSLNSSYNEGVEFYTKGLYSEAIVSFTNAIEKNQFDFDAYYNRGVSYIKMGNKEKACLDWSQCAYYHNDAALNIINKYCDSLVIIDSDTLYSGSFVEDSKLEKINSKSYPAYPGGISQMKKFISGNIQKPKEYNNYNKVVYVKCIIGRKGEILSPKVISKCDKPIETETLRVVNTMPRFIPATRNNVPIDVYYTIAVSFKN